MLYAATNHTPISDTWWDLGVVDDGRKVLSFHQSTVIIESHRDTRNMDENTFPTTLQSVDRYEFSGCLSVNEKKNVH